MPLTHRLHGKVEILTLSGRIDGYIAEPLYDALTEPSRPGIRPLVIDMARVRELTNSGLRGLVVTATLLISAGAATRLACADTTVENRVSPLGDAPAQCAALEITSAQFVELVQYQYPNPAHT